MFLKKIFLIYIFFIFNIFLLKGYTFDQSKTLRQNFENIFTVNVDLNQKVIYGFDAISLYVKFNLRDSYDNVLDYLDLIEMSLFLDKEFLQIVLMSLYDIKEALEQIQDGYIKESFIDLKVYAIKEHGTYENDFIPFYNEEIRHIILNFYNSEDFLVEVLDSIDTFYSEIESKYKRSK